MTAYNRRENADLISSPAFDAVAASYDSDFTASPLAQWLRAQVHTRLKAHFKSGDRVLEIGCGTGEDALWLAKQGVSVLATDVSPAMLKITHAKADSAGFASQIETALLDLNAPFNLKFPAPFDGAFSNFGAVNCTQRWPALANFLANVIRPGGYVGMAIMSPFCLWETVWHSLHLDFRTAFRRWRRQSTATIGSQTLPVYYPSPRQITRAFQLQFQRTALSGLGVFLPPSDIFGVIEKRPRLQHRLLHLEERFAHYYPFRAWADHYWIEFRRTKKISD